MSWAQNFGWRKKAELLRMVIVSVGHVYAKPLSAPLAKLFELYRTLATDSVADEAGFLEEMKAISNLAEMPDALTWEPLEIRGWRIDVSMYLKTDDLNPNKTHLWWVVNSHRLTDAMPSAGDIGFLEKIVAHLGADLVRDLIIGPSDQWPIGWWTWKNTSQLFETQVNKTETRVDKMCRVVPLGAAESDGYVRLPIDED